jgi:DNA polymerase-3 subunit alpha
MQIAQVLAGYTLGGADLLRRAMGKKKPEEMAKERVKFEDGAENGGIREQAQPDLRPDGKVRRVRLQQVALGAYALVAYQTAWLKVHYPAEFMAAVLSSDMDNTDKVVGFLDEARRHGPDGAAAGRECLRLHVRGDGRDDDPLRHRRGEGRRPRRLRGDRRRAPRRPFADLLDFCKRVDSSKLNRARWKH